MKIWLAQALELLKTSLEPPQHELNELDWKSDLSPDKQRLTEHLSAFSNRPGGGFLVFGIGPKGTVINLNETQVTTIIGQLGNLGRCALEPPISLDHAIEPFGSGRVLFVHIPESLVKPVHIRGKNLECAYVRVGGATRPASRPEIGAMLLHSRTPRWEETRASGLLDYQSCIERLNVEAVLKILKHPKITDTDELINWMVTERFIVKEPTHGVFVTNLGVIAAAKKLSDFPDLALKAVRVIIYDGLNKAKTKHEQEGVRGYAIVFQGLMKYVMNALPRSEVVKNGLRAKETVYPEIALREIIANALIHQDFSITGTGPLIEIFNNRVEVSNPGELLPSLRLDRLIGAQPLARNEWLASAFRRYNICEQRGSGLVKAGVYAELYGLPPIRFTADANTIKVTLFAPRPFAKMLPKERLEACYQHTVIKHFSDSRMTNKSLRERLKMSPGQRSMVSRLIQEAVKKRLIKPVDPENKSPKFAEYMPAWAS
jgi:ATP-dependent DNA helicase RecG